MATKLTEQDAAEVLRRALADELTVDEASKLLSGLPQRTRRNVQDAIHAAVHFVSDADIRQSDAEYNRLQRASLIKRLDDLRR